MSSEALDFTDPDEAERLGEIVTLQFTKSNYSKRAPSLLLRRLDEQGGALAPLDAADLERVAKARGDTSASLAERRVKAEAREQADAARRGEHAEQDERAALRVVVRRPGMNTADWLTAIKREARCAEKRASDAMRVVRQHLDVRAGPARALLHHPPPSADGLPKHLREELGHAN
jgi:hypothetical protein